ncbi:MAG TPA: hypothetical protein VIO32_08860, partial [Candidatus Baltobacteraceae bacterium]
MASVTSSRARNRIDPLAALVPPVTDALRSCPVPLLALRLPEFERIAWRDGKRAAQRVERMTVSAFIESAARTLRTGDRCGHTAGSDVFVIVMTARSREARQPAPVDVRAVLERVAATIALESGLRVETGWTLVRRLERHGDLEPEISAALER